jgi:outer membrane protein TolC
MNVTNANSDAGPNVLPGRVGSARYLFMQTLPWWGKRDLKRDAALAEAGEAQAKADAAWAELAARIKAVYALHWQMAGLIRLNREAIVLTDQLEALAATRYAQGIAPQQEAIRARLERSAAEGELVAMETEQHHLQSRLNALLGRSAHATLAEPRQLPAVPPPVRLDTGRLTDLALARNPQMLAENAAVTGAEKKRELVLKNRYPDVTLGVAPSQMGSRVGQWDLMLELNIPLWQDSRRSAEREAERTMEAAKVRRAAVANRLGAELAESTIALEGARRSERLIATGILPQAEITYQSALAAYENGKADFALLLDAQRQIRKAKQDLLRAEAEQRVRLAEIERIVGDL